jgi:hypothetical protein
MSLPGHGVQEGGQFCSNEPSVGLGWFQMFGPPRAAKVAQNSAPLCSERPVSVCLYPPPDIYLLLYYAYGDRHGPEYEGIGA